MISSFFSNWITIGKRKQITHTYILALLGFLQTSQMLYTASSLVGSWLPRAKTTFLDIAVFYLFLLKVKSVAMLWHKSILLQGSKNTTHSLHTTQHNSFSQNLFIDKSNVLYFEIMNNWSSSSLKHVLYCEIMNN